MLSSKVMARIFFLTVLALTCSLQHISAEIVAESDLILLGRANAPFDKLENLKMGDSYTYYNVIEYNDMHALFTPYPWQDGRVRNGKYKASPKAMDDYLKSLKALSGKKFKAVKTVSNINSYYGGVIMVDEKGDSIFYVTGHSKLVMQFEFVHDASFSKLKDLVGKSIVNTKPIMIGHDDGILYPEQLINSKTNKPMVVLEPLVWKVTKVSIDTTYYYGEHEMSNNIRNARLPHVSVYITNNKYGDCFFNLQLNDSFTLQDEDLIYNKFSYSSLYISSEADASIIKDMASTGDPSALYVQWRINRTDEMDELLSKSIEGGNVYAAMETLRGSLDNNVMDEEKKAELAEELWKKGLKSEELSGYYYISKSSPFIASAENWVIALENKGKYFDMFTRQVKNVDISKCRPNIEKYCKTALNFLNKAKDCAPSSSYLLNSIEKDIKKMNSYLLKYCSD